MLGGGLLYDIVKDDPESKMWSGGLHCHDSLAMVHCPSISLGDLVEPRKPDYIFRCFEPFIALGILAQGGSIWWLARASETRLTGVSFIYFSIGSFTIVRCTVVVAAGISSKAKIQKNDVSCDVSKLSRQWHTISHAFWDDCLLDIDHGDHCG